MDYEAALRKARKLATEALDALAAAQGPATDHQLFGAKIAAEKSLILAKQALDKALDR